ncbi:MAG: hypothetical protein LBJ12_09400 [Oscillospiraceae bacterium]|jgi:hypothetical protein|nr:hypothetical protein [Oscillospiraceae bacterium]
MLAERRIDLFMGKLTVQSKLLWVLIGVVLCILILAEVFFIVVMIVGIIEIKAGTSIFSPIGGGYTPK